MQYWNTRTYNHYNQGAVDDLGGASAIANIEHPNKNTLKAMAKSWLF